MTVARQLPQSVLAGQRFGAFFRISHQTHRSAIEQDNQTHLGYSSRAFDAALQPMDAPKPSKAARNGAHLKTSESAPSSVDIVANVPSNA